MNNWIIVIILTMWAGIVHYLYLLHRKTAKLEKQLDEIKESQQ